jgi:hypothetical protein
MKTMFPQDGEGHNDPILLHLHFRWEFFKALHACLESNKDLHIITEF